MSKITTHVLDVSLGRPALGIAVILEAESPAGNWNELGRGVTGDDGRIKDLATGKDLPPGIYRLIFDTGAYFTQRQVAGFYPQVTVIFEVKQGQEHHHIPLLLSPFGYSTYRGS